MRRRLTLHIGTPGSGVGHLQTVLRAARPALARAGVLYPGAGYLPQQGLSQQAAIRALVDAADGDAAAHFQVLCAEVAGHRGHTVLSAEALALLDPESGRSLIERLGVAPDQVTVVITARDPARSMSRRWQQQLQDGSAEQLEAFVRQVEQERAAAHPGPAVRPAPAALPELVARWTQVVGAGQVVLVTASHEVDGAGSQLGRRFAIAAELDQAVVGAPVTDRRLAEQALTPSQAEMLRQLNVVLAADGYPAERCRQLRARLLGIWRNLDPVPGATPLGLPAVLDGAVERWAKEDIRLLAGQGVRVVGVLQDLLPAPRPAGSPAGSPVIAVETARDVLALLEHGRGSGVPPRPERSGWRVRFGRSQPARSTAAAVAPTPSTVVLPVQRPVEPNDVTLPQDHSADPVP